MSPTPRVQRFIKRPHGFDPMIVRGSLWLITSAGIVGILVVLGFQVDGAQQDLFGYEFPEVGSVARYVALAGEFVLGSFGNLFAWIEDHLLLTLGILALLIIGRILSTSFEDRLPNLQTRFLLLGGLLFLELVAFDLPSLRVKDLLVSDASYGSSFPTTLVGKRAHAIWRNHLCSRLSVTQYDALEEHGLHCSGAPEEHVTSLRDGFLLNFSATLFLVALLVFLAQKLHAGPTRAKPEGSLVARVWPLGAPLVYVVMVANLMALPYTYAKTVRPTAVNEVVVLLESLEPEPPSLRHDARATDSTGASAPDTTRESPTSETRWIAESGFLLDRGTDEIVLFNKAEDRIWLIPHGHVKLLRIMQKTDVVQIHILRALGHDVEAPPETATDPLPISPEPAEPPPYPSRT